MEGEANFLTMLPQAARVKERDFWYRDANPDLKVYISDPVFDKQSIPGITYRSDDPKLELYAMLRQRLADVLPTKHDMASIQDTGVREQLNRLNQLVGKPATVMPENALLQVKTNAGSMYFTLLRNSAYANMTAVFGDSKNRLPDEDTLTVLPGFIGAYPNAFFVVAAQRLPDFVDALSGLETESGYSGVVDTYGIRRSNSDFWVHSDAFHEGYRKLSPLTYGVLDYSRFENR